MHDPSDKQVPYYQQVAMVLRTRIVSSDGPEPIHLPTEEELCSVHSVSRVTIRKALKILQDEGLIQRTPRRGTVTLPQGIRAWKHRHQDLPIYVVTSWERCALSTDVPVTFHGQIYQGICRRCEEEGYWISTQQLPGRAYDGKRQVTPPDRQSALGVIVIGVISETLLQEYTDAGYPVVCADYYTPNICASTVVLDCFTEGQLAAQYLIESGHTDLFYIGNLWSLRHRPQKEPDAELMLAGIQRALAYAGRPPLCPERISFCRTLTDTIDSAAEWFLRMRPRPTAGIIFQREAHEYFASALAARGLQVPRDVSLISKALKGKQGDLTCLLADAQVLGEAAVDVLLHRALGRISYAERSLVPTQPVCGPFRVSPPAGRHP